MIQFVILEADGSTIRISGSCPSEAQADLQPVPAGLTKIILPEDQAPVSWRTHKYDPATKAFVAKGA